jgi:hypothetical protein
MIIMKPVEVTTAITHTPLLQTSADAHREYTISNFSRRTLYIMTPNEEVYSIPSKPVLFMNDNRDSGCVRISVIDKVVGVPDSRGIITTVANDYNRIMKTTRVAASSLFSDSTHAIPYYIEEANVVICFDNDPKLMRNAHPVLRVKYHTEFVDALKESIGSGSSTPLVITANSWDESVNTVYLAVFNEIVAIPVGHERSEDEHVTIAFNNFGVGRAFRRVRFRDESLFKEYQCDTVRKLMCSTNKDDVVEYINKQRLLEQETLTPAQIKQEIALAVKDKEDLLSQANKTIENLRKQLELTQNERNNYKTELTRVNDEAKETSEQRKLKLRDSIAQKEYETATAKIEAERKNTDLKTESDNKKLQGEIMSAKATIKKSESDVTRTDLDVQVSQLKVETAKASASAKLADSAATYVKAAAVIVPVLCGIFLWCARGSTASAIMSIAGVAAAPTAILGLLAAGAKYIVCNCRDALITGATSICDCINKVKSYLADKVTDIARSVCHGVSNFAGKALDFSKCFCSAFVDICKNCCQGVRSMATCLIDGFTNIISTIYNGISNAVSGLVSVITNIKNTICDWFSFA